MKADPKVLVALQASLQAHWLAMETYRAQAAHLGRAGYGPLAKAAAEDVAEEGEHADRLLRRLEEFEVAPGYDHPSPMFPRLPDYVGLLEANLRLEQGACEIEREGIAACRAAQDERTALLLAENLAGSEASIVKIEAALAQIRAVTLPQWLASQI